MADRIVVLGLGNVLLTDDGVGVAALHRLARTVHPDPLVSMIDGGTLGMALLDFVDPESTLIIVDAVRAPGPPGTVVVLEGKDVAEAAAGKLSPHQFGVSDLLAVAEHVGRTPRRTILVGVVPEAIELGIERTPAVEAAIPELVATVIAEVARAGVMLRPGGYAGVEVSAALGV